MAKVRFKHRLEYGFMTMMGFFLAHAPYRLALFKAWVLAWIAHRVLGYRKAAARSRIREVFPHLSSREVSRIAWRSWVNFVFNSIEMFRLHHVTDRWIERHVIGQSEARDFILNHCDTGVGAVIASPHMGAVEMAAVVLQRFGVPVFMITGRQKNPLVDRRLNEMRATTQIPLIQKGTSLLKSVIRRLRQGEVLAFLADLRVRKGGIMVKFLGKTASVAPGMALFAKQTRVPILPAIFTRVGWTRHRIVFMDPVWPDETLAKAEDQQRMTQIVFDHIDTAIRKEPEQWFWFNKSWILAPVQGHDKPDTRG
jgi:lauroyl/myristoyl acyltransferase